jgi:hypothetical protein
MYGPELWRPDKGGDWSYWDLWFAVLCVHDHGGDWDGFDAALTKIRGDGGEAKWSHLLDLRERLAAAGLDAVELVGDTITEKGLVTRARARVFKQSLSVCDMTRRCATHPRGVWRNAAVVGGGRASRARRRTRTIGCALSWDSSGSSCRRRPLAGMRLRTWPVTWTGRPGRRRICGWPTTTAPGRWRCAGRC